MKYKKELTHLYNNYLSGLPEVILFLNTLSNENYIIAISKLREVFIMIQNHIDKMEDRIVCRIVCTIGSGNVWFDSNNRDEKTMFVTSSKTNNYLNFKNSTIGQNHNTRIGFIKANFKDYAYEYKLVIANNGQTKNQYRYIVNQKVEQCTCKTLGCIGFSFETPLTEI